MLMKIWIFRWRVYYVPVKYGVEQQTEKTYTSEGNEQNVNNQVMLKQKN